MGHHYHARVVIDGHVAYNLGGDTCKYLKDQISDRNWNPMVSSYMVDLGIQYHLQPNVEHPTYVTIFMITRLPSRKRRIDAVHQYWYDKDGKLVGVIHRNTKVLHIPSVRYIPLPFDPGDFTYKYTINTMDFRQK